MQTERKIILSSSPHIWDKTTTSTLMRDVLIALLPTWLAAMYIFGTAALWPVLVCMVSCVFFEWGYQTMMKKPVTVGDFSALLTGLLLGLNMPPAVPLYIAVFASLAAIVMVKQLYGGIGHNFVNPAITGRIIALVSFGLPMSTYLLPAGTAASLDSGFGVDLVAGATPLALLAEGRKAALPSLMDMLLGFRGGSIGETCAITLIIGGLYLIYRGVITYHIPLAYLGGVAALALLFGQDPVYHLLSGGVLLGAFFMATDYVTSPITERGKWVFGLGCALITMVIRVFGSLPEGASYSIIIMNILTPHINNLTLVKPLGGIQK
jgi:electron transport complex protein RnfD